MTRSLTFDIPDRVQDEFTDDEVALLTDQHEVTIDKPRTERWYVRPTPTANRETVTTEPELRQPNASTRYECECGDTFDNGRDARGHVERVAALRRKQMAVPESNPVTWTTETRYTDPHLDATLSIRKSKPFSNDGFVFDRWRLGLVTDESDLLATQTMPHVQMPSGYDFHQWRDGSAETLALLDAALRALTGGGDYDPAEYVLYNRPRDSFALVGPDRAVLLADIGASPF